jgi:glycine C-acetyltransferase
MSFLSLLLSVIFYQIIVLDLEAKLQEAEGARIKLIATDGVFSMDGTISPLKYVYNASANSLLLPSDHYL